MEIGEALLWRCFFDNSVRTGAGILYVCVFPLRFYAVLAANFRSRELSIDFFYFVFFAFLDYWSENILSCSTRSVVFYPTANRHWFTCLRWSPV